jgi:hypothetical protein
MLNLFHTRKNCKCLNNKLLQQTLGHAYACTEWRWRQLLTIRKPAVEAGEWSAPRSGSFTPGKDLVPVIQEARVARLGFTENLTNQDSIAGPPVRDGTQYRILLKYFHQNKKNADDSDISTRGASYCVLRF